MPAMPPNDAPGSKQPGRPGPGMSGPAHSGRTAQPTVTPARRVPREVDLALAGELPYDELSAAEQAQVRAVWRERTENSRLSLNLASEFESRGEAYSELDQHGRVVRRDPLPGGDSPQRHSEAAD